MKKTLLVRMLSVGAALALVVPTTIPAAHAADVHIPDDGFRTCLNDHLAQPADSTLAEAELASIQDLECNDHPRDRRYRIKDLSGAEHLTGAARISLRHNGISDLTPLSGLTGLQDLNLEWNHVTDVSALSGLTGLRSLSLTGNRITDASALAGILDQFGQDGLGLYGQHLSFTTELGQPLVVPPLRDASGHLADIATCDTLFGPGGDCTELISTSKDGTTFTPEFPGEYNLAIEGPGRDDYRLSAAVKVTRPSDPVEVSFADNPAGSAFYAPIQWMATEGISVGYADGTFKKNKDVSRGEAAQFLYLLADESYASSRAPFTDVHQAFRTAVSWFAARNVSVGYTDGTFRPNQPVTRGEFAAFLYRLHQPQAFTPPQRSPFTDVNVGGSHWAAITWLDTTGITTGYGDGSFKPGKTISRAEVAAFLHRYHQLDQ
jgi:hypothetical protein